mmetsp:Transcript_23530/g.54151  ORF Transcript_23530/g.54151 Transcript_23530/m.54151 type:complete len:302 (+) Transcript_23530:1574-2479(+)
MVHKSLGQLRIRTSSSTSRPDLMPCFNPQTDSNKNGFMPPYRRHAMPTHCSPSASAGAAKCHTPRSAEARHMPTAARNHTTSSSISTNVSLTIQPPLILCLLIAFAPMPNAIDNTDKPRDEAVMRLISTGLPSPAEAKASTRSTTIKTESGTASMIVSRAFAMKKLNSCRPLPSCRSRPKNRTCRFARGSSTVRQILKGTEYRSPPPPTVNAYVINAIPARTDSNMNTIAAAPSHQRPLSFISDCLGPIQKATTTISDKKSKNCTSPATTAVPSPFTFKPDAIVISRLISCALSLSWLEVA